MQYDDDPDVYVDRNKVLADSFHVARKQHECEGCLRGCIGQGDRYRKVVMLDHDGRFEIVRWCVLPCAHEAPIPATGRHRPYAFTLADDEIPF